MKRYIASLRIQWSIITAPSLKYTATGVCWVCSCSHSVLCRMIRTPKGLPRALWVPNVCLSGLPTALHNEQGDCGRHVEILWQMSFLNVRILKGNMHTELGLAGYSLYWTIESREPFNNVIDFLKLNSAPDN